MPTGTLRVNTGKTPSSASRTSLMPREYEIMRRWRINLANRTQAHNRNPMRRRLTAERNGP
jgi:hypothetical protein